ncbi:hypothetical protein C5F48_17385 [Cereibacter changlensis JA139]|uniref:Uncharacterized protein n=2 Tax=Cereibacter changlensis TaxID=402884 RepID=A0A2T4JRC8_9RHOB|nr:hypothetical protein [Cereibacter changlensis]PTE20465.1 hypothetical protein C5F48_17385 [Cereibacter changlensis JA139]PZX54508.1 hypothetical protein LX76_02155 [Cereibacter changlensis]
MTFTSDNRSSAVMIASAVVLGAFGALAVRQLMKSDRGGFREIRNAGTRSMQTPPRDWDETDEELDESFPASDPPGNY